LLIALPSLLPSLTLPFHPDELQVIAPADGIATTMAQPLDLWGFSSGVPDEVRAFVQRGYFPWYTAAGFKYQLWRPLSSAVLLGHHAVFGSHRVGYQVGAWLWYLAAVVIAALIFRRSLPAVPAAVALLLFAVNPYHRQPVAWLSAGHYLFVLVPSLLGVWAHLRWREERWRPGLPLSVTGFVLGLLAGEVALQVIAYVVAYQLLSGAQRNRRLSGLLPVLVVVVAYLAAYRLLGRGMHGLDVYRDPFDDHARYLAGVLRMLPRMLAGLVTDLGVWMTPIPHPLFLTAGFLVVVSLLLRRGGCGGAGWLGAGALLACLPALGGPVGHRSFLVPSLGSSAVLALVICRGVQALRDSGAPGWERALAALAVPILIVLHVVLTPWEAATAINDLRRASLGFASVSRLAIDPASDRDVIALVAPPDPEGQWAGLVRQVLTGRRTRSWLSLSTTREAHEITRTGPETFELGPVSSRPFNVRFFRNPTTDPMPEGTEVATGRLRVRVVSAEEGVPTRIRVVCDRALDDPSLAFVAWSRGGFSEVQWPPIGQSLVLP